MTDGVDPLAALEQGILDDAPVASLLRRCVLLGGRADSVELREWAARELNGYHDAEDDVPNYRRIPSPIMIDQMQGRQWARGLVISPSVLPEFAREMFAGGPIIYQGIGTVEEMSRDASVASTKMTHQHANDVAAVMDRDSGNPFQQTIALYWTVSRSSLIEVVEQVKTRLVMMVAEMRTHTAVDELPTQETVRDAVRKALGSSSRESRS